MGFYKGLLPFRWGRANQNGHQNYYKRIDRQGNYFTKRKAARRPKMQRLGSRGTRSWGLRIPKMKIRIVSPFNLLARLRDAYVKLMMNLAGKGTIVGAACGPMGALKGPPSRDVHPHVLNHAELLYLDYLRRDPTFMRSVFG